MGSDFFRCRGGARARHNRAWELPDSEPRATGIAWKPVLYAHLYGVEEAAFSAAVTVPDGSVVEHWPDGELSDGEGGAQLRWPRVIASGDSCLHRTYPEIASERCALPDHFCEAAELELYETDDSACLEVADRRYNHLFYRADVPSSVPLEVTMSDGVATIRNRGQYTIPGQLMRVVYRVDEEHHRVTYLPPPPRVRR